VIALGAAIMIAVMAGVVMWEKPADSGSRHTPVTAPSRP
jgi:hypothetical protein